MKNLRYKDGYWTVGQLKAVLHALVTVAGVQISKSVDQFDVWSHGMPTPTN